MTGFAFATSERCSMVDQAHFESLEMPRVENWCGMGKALPSRDIRDGSFCNSSAVNHIQQIGKGLLGHVLFSEIEQPLDPFQLCLHLMGSFPNHIRPRRGQLIRGSSTDMVKSGPSGDFSDATAIDAKPGCDVMLPVPPRKHGFDKCRILFRQGNSAVLSSTSHIKTFQCAWTKAVRVLT